MTASLTGVNAKIERAKKHVRDLEEAVQGFFQTNPYEIQIQDNTEAEQRQWMVVRAEPIPLALSLVVGDVLHNLRSALDHLIWQLVLANGRKPSDYRTSFPIWDTKAKYKADRPGQAEGISQPALDLLYGLKPYKGGNSALWTLHRLDITDKHRLLLTIATAHSNVIIDFGALMRTQFAQQQPELDWISKIPQMEVPIVPADRAVIARGVQLFGAPLGQRHEEVKFTIDVTLDEPGVVKREPLIPLLSQLTSAVEQTIELFAPLIS